MVMHIVAFGDGVLYRDDEGSAPVAPLGAYPSLLAAFIPGLIHAEVVGPEADHGVPLSRCNEDSVYGKNK